MKEFFHNLLACVEKFKCKCCEFFHNHLLCKSQCCIVIFMRKPQTISSIKIENEL